MELDENGAKMILQRHIFRIHLKGLSAEGGVISRGLNEEKTLLPDWEKKRRSVLLEVQITAEKEKPIFSGLSYRDKKRSNRLKGQRSEMQGPEKKKLTVG